MPDRLLYGTDPLAQPGLVPRGGVPVQDALLNRLVECGYLLAVLLLGHSLVSLGDGLAQGAQLAAQAGCVGAVASRAAFGLAGGGLRGEKSLHVLVCFLFC